MIRVSVSWGLVGYRNCGGTHKDHNCHISKVCCFTIVLCKITQNIIYITDVDRIAQKERSYAVVSLAIEY